MTLSFNIKIHCKCLIRTVHSSADYESVDSAKIRNYEIVLCSIQVNFSQTLWNNPKNKKKTTFSLMKIRTIKDSLKHTACCHFHLDD